MTASDGVGGWLDANGIRTVRLVATNHDGVLLGKYVSAPKLASTLRGGSMLADTCFGLDVAGDVMLGFDWGPWRGEVADIRLSPDPATLLRDPAAEGWATAICDFTDPEGHPLPVCFRGMLKRMIARLERLGYTASVSPEIEFMAFEEPIQRARAQGYRDLTPLGGSTRVTYLVSRSPDVARFMDAVTWRLEELGIPWESWSNETAPGQIEINLAPGDPLAVADQVTRAKLALREVAAEHERSVTFMAMGIDEHLGSGMHINLSLQRGGASAFYDEASEGNRSQVARRWTAGMLTTLPATMSFLSPNPNSYRRLVEITGPPTTVTWGEDNKSVAVRTITRDPDSSRIEHRVAASDCNIYLALAAIIAGGMVGLERELEPPPEFEGMAWCLPPGTVEELPRTLKRAAAALAADEPLAGMLGREAVDYWLGTREWEWRAFHTGGGDPDAVTDYELRRYFEQA